MQDVEKIAGYDKLNALGLSMTQEIWLDMGAAARTTDNLQECARKYEQPLAAKADAQWIGDTRVFRPFLARDEKDFPLVERAIRQGGTERPIFRTGVMITAGSTMATGIPESPCGPNASLRMCTATGW